MASRRLAIGSVYVLVLLLLGVTDAVLTRDLNILPGAGSGESSEPTVGVRRQTGPGVFETLSELGIVTEATREASLLEQIVPEGAEVSSRVILKQNDRLAFFAWVDSPDVKVYFTALKDALHTSFSSELQDLVDENQERPGKPVRNVLSFLDPAIHEERVLFVRVRQRLFEFHVAPGKEGEIQELMDELTE